MNLKPALLTSLLTTLVIGCAAALKESPDPTGPRPALDQGGFVSHTEEITVGVPIRFLVEWRRSKPLETTLRGTARIAGVARTEMIRGIWGDVGARRRVVRKDGNQTLEEILENDQPTWFRYEVWGFTDSARIFTNYAVGEFQYSEVPGGTAVKWTYSFHRTSLFAQPFLSWRVQTDFAEFMRSTLQTMKERAEESWARRE
jgi:hypothetical protein